MALKNKQRIFLAQEFQENLALTPASDIFVAGAGKYLAIDPTIEFDPNRIQRNVSRGTLTPSQGITGLIPGVMKFGLEITGTSGGIASFNQLDLPMRASGFRREALVKVYIDAIVGGPFIHGESLTIAGVAGSGICVRYAWDGAPCLYIAQGNGLGVATAIVNADTIVGATSGASTNADGAGTVNAALGYWPVSAPTTRLSIGTLADATGGVAVGDILRGVTSGSVGVVQVATANGASALVYIEHISGTWTTEVVERVTGTPDTDIGTITAILQLHNPTIGAGMTKDGVRECMSGARGTASFRLPNGDLPIANFELRGSYLQIADGANVTGIADSTIYTPSAVLAAGFRMGPSSSSAYTSWTSPCAALIELDIANQIAQRACMNADSGILGQEITARQPRCTVDPELAPEAFSAVMGRFIGNTNTALECFVRPVLKSDRSSKTFLFQVPNAGTVSATTGERERRLTRQLTFEPNAGTGTNTVTPHDADIIVVYDLTVDATSGV